MDGLPGSDYPPLDSSVFSTLLSMPSFGNQLDFWLAAGLGFGEDGSRLLAGSCMQMREWLLPHLLTDYVGCNVVLANRMHSGHSVQLVKGSFSIWRCAVDHVCDWIATGLNCDGHPPISLPESEQYAVYNNTKAREFLRTLNDETLRDEIRVLLALGKEK